ncbi:MAG: HAD family hydrolase [Selenomonadaceae bacterium]
MEKAVFFDIDGTLIDSGHGMPYMSQRTKQAIRDLQAAGHYTFIASGRPYAFLDKEILEFGFDGYILMNGATVILGDKVIYKKALPDDFVQDTCNLCEENQVEYILQGTHHVYLKNKFSGLDEFYTSFHIAKDHFIYDFDRTRTSAYKMEFLAQNEKGKALYHSLLNADMTGIQDPAHNMNFELYARAETKATGIRHTLDYLSIPIENSFAFGDGENDREMMCAVGCSFAMGNAQPSLKKFANYTVDSVRNDGVAEGISRYILNQAHIK